MIITIPTAAFVRELQICAGVVEKKTTIPVLACVLLDAQPAALPGDRATLTLTGSDLSLMVRCTIDADIHEGGRVAVPCARLLAWTKTLEGESLQIRATAGWVSLACGKAKTRMATMGADLYPSSQPPPPGVHCELPARMFAAAINRTIFAVSKEESRFNLNGALLDFKEDGKARLVTTDGHRLALAEFPITSPDEPRRTLVSYGAMRELAKLAELAQLGEAFRYSYDAQGNTHMQYYALGDRLLSARAVAGNFPEYERVIPRDYANGATLPTKALARALGRSTLFTDDRTRAVRVEYNADGCEVSSVLADAGEASEQVDGSTHGAEMSSGYNAGYLLEFLAVAGSEQVSVKYKNSDAATVLSPVATEQDAGQYVYVVMPMRI